MSLVFSSCSVDMFCAPVENRYILFRFLITVGDVMIEIRDQCRDDGWDEEEEGEEEDDEEEDNLTNNCELTDGHAVSIILNGQHKVNVPIDNNTVSTIISYLGGKRLPITYNELFDKYAKPRLDIHGLHKKQIIESDFHYLCGCFKSNDSCDDSHNCYSDPHYAHQEFYRCCKWDLSGLFMTDLEKAGHCLHVLFIDIPLEII